MKIVDDPTSPEARSPRTRWAARELLRRLEALRPWLLFVIALALHVGGIALRRSPEIRSENLHAGFTLAQKGFLGDPFIVPTGPTGHLAPVYPVVVAAAYAVTGSERKARMLLSLVCAVVASVAVALLVPLARALRLPPGSGALAALFWAVPLFTMLELSAEHETLFSTTMVMLVLTVIAHRLLAPELRARDGAMLGAVSGIGAHITPLALPMTLLAIAGGVLARRPRPRLRPSFAAAFVAALALVVTPYTIRNWRVMGAPFFIRDNFGLEIAVSNADNARITADANLDVGAAMDTHPTISTAAADQVRVEGEVAYNRRRLHEGLAWIRAHPSQFVSMVAKRGALLLVPWSRRPYQRVIVALISLGFLIGLVRLWRSDNRVAAGLLGGAVIGYDAIYLLVQHDIRYVYPMLRVESLVAAAMVVSVAARAAMGAEKADGAGESFVDDRRVVVEFES